jgi:adenine-specific DNA glycosylase
VLDLGATVCAPVMPDCLRCPLLDCCASASKLARQQIMPW